MPQLEFFIVAESIAVDQGTNRLSLFNILEELHPIELPPRVGIPPGIPQFVAASSWNLDPAEIGHTFRVTLNVLVPGSPEPQNLGEIEFTAERRRQRLLQTVVGFGIPGPGELRFEVLLNGEHKASHSVTINDPEPSP